MKLLLILAAVIPALVLLVQVYRADRLEKEPIPMLLGLILCGVIAAELASLTERGGIWLLSQFLDTGALTKPSAVPAMTSLSKDTTLLYVLVMFVVVAVSEEGFKYLLLRLRTWKSPEFNCSFDGIVYAVFLSLGFALWENIQYVLQYGFATALARAVTAVPGHACFGVFMGTWYGLAKRWALRWRFGRSGFCSWMAFLIPTVLHGFYDYIALTETNRTGLMFLPFISGLFLVSFLTVRHMSRNDSYMN